ncbi:MAG: prephenate dehydratase domain-containing protein, partial [Alphaproteobacteria bacterium]
MAEPPAASSPTPEPAPDRIIAFQGVPGAYSHLACREACPELEHRACESFEEAFGAVQEGRAGRAMIPIENSLAGRVADIHHLIPDSGLYIVGEHFQRVNHQLLVLPGTALDDLKLVRSHVQALSQCRDFVRAQGLKPMVHADTAGAAAEVAEQGDKSQAVIASALAGEIYGLEILKSD